MQLPLLYIRPIPKPVLINSTQPIPKRVLFNSTFDTPQHIENVSDSRCTSSNFGFGIRTAPSKIRHTWFNEPTGFSSSGSHDEKKHSEDADKSLQKGGRALFWRLDRWMLLKGFLESAIEYPQRVIFCHLTWVIR